MRVGVVFVGILLVNAELPPRPVGARVVFEGVRFCALLKSTFCRTILVQKAVREGRHD